MRNILKTVGGITFAALICGCSGGDTRFEYNEIYAELSEPEQAKYMQQLVSDINAAPSPGHSPSISKPVYVGDSIKDILTATSTYHKAVSDAQLKRANKAIMKMARDNPTCAQAEAIALTELGIGFQAIMTDINGRELYRSEICKGAASILSSNVPKLRGVTARR